MASNENEHEGMYLTLPSDIDSADFNDINKISNYHTKLSTNLNLQNNEWEIGMYSFSYKNTWNNIEDGASVIIYEVSPSESIVKGRTFSTDSVPLTLKTFKTKEKLQFYKSIRSGRYSDMWNIIREIRQSWSDIFITDSNNKSIRIIDHVSLFYDTIRDKCVLQVRHENISVTFSKDIGFILGFSLKTWFGFGTHIGKYTTDLRVGFNSLYVYCDLVEPQHVGVVMAPLLRSIPIRGSKNEVSFTEFKNIMYVPTIASETNVISLDIRRDDGEPVPFNGGKVEAIVHLRRRKRF